MRVHTIAWMVVGMGVVMLGEARPRAAEEPAEQVEVLDGSTEAVPDDATWDALLWRYVDAGLVDYEGLKQKERSQVDAYVAGLNRVDVSRLPSREAQLAFWINAYNACVVQGVLDVAPTKSVKEINGFFDKIEHQVAGKPMTLNEIEAKARALKDWRVHMALVCAASSCPFLRSEAYAADRLSDQLSDQASEFLADPERGLRVDASAGVLWVSKIFKWYAKDIVPQGTLTPETLVPVLEPYLDPLIVKTLQAQPLTVQFFDYDWTLNSQALAEQHEEDAESLHRNFASRNF